MSGQLRLQVLLSAVDKITKPLRSTGEAASRASQNIRATQGRIRELNDQAKRVDGFRQTQNSLQTTGRELNAAQQRAQQLSREFRNTQNPTKAMAREMKSAQADVRRLRDQKDSLTRTAREQRSALQQSGVNTRNLAQESRNLSQQTDQATQALARQKRELQQVNEQTKRLTNARQAYDKTMQFRGQLAGGGARAAAGGGAALYAGARTMAPGLEFEATMSRVQSLARLEKESEEMQAIMTQARQLGATTAFSASEVGEGQAFLAMAGFDSSAIMAAMPAMLNLSKAGDLALSSTADIASNILSAFKMAPEEMTRVADVLTAASTRANVDLSMLGETMKYMAPVAAGLGVSVEESAAMAALLGNIGIQGSMAGTTLREMFNRITNQTGPAAEAMEKLGLSVADSEGNMRSMPEILQDVVNATEGMGNVEQRQILGTIFGSRAGAGISELLEQQGQGAIEEFIKILEAAEGESMTVAVTMADNTQGDLMNLRSAWEDIGIELFVTSGDSIRELIQNITSAVRGVGEWMKANPELVKTLTKVVGVTAALAVAGGTVALTIAGLLGPFAMLRYATSVLGIKLFPVLVGTIKALTIGVVKFGIALLTTPIGWIALAVAALVVGIIALWKNWDKVTGFFSNIDWSGALRKGFEIAKSIFSWSPLGLLTRGFSAAANWLGQIDWAGRAAQVWDLMKTVFKWSPLGLIIQGFTAVLDWVRGVDWHGAAAEAWELMKTIFKWSPLGLIIQGWQGTFDFFTNLPERFSGFGADILNGLMGGITGKLAEVRDTVTGAAESVAGWFKDKLGISSPSKVFQQFGDDTMNGLAIGLGDNAAPVKEMDRNINKLKAAAAGSIIMLGAVAMPATADAGEPPTAYAEQQQRINQVVEPARMVQMPSGTMTIAQELQAAPLPQIEDATRTIRERVDSAGMPDNSDVIRRIQTDEQGFTQQRNIVSQPAPQLTQQFTTDIAPGAIVIQAAPGQSAQDIAREVARQIDERERRAAARERSRFTDLE